MKFVKRLFLAFGALAVVGVSLTLLSPKARALAATLVQVSNTTANPVPSFTAGRVAYQSFRNAACNDPNFCFATFDPAPPGFRLVAENLSGELTLTAPGTPARVVLQSGGIGTPIFAGIATPGSTFSGQTDAAFNLNIKAYVPAGASPFLSISGYLSMQTPLNVTLSGYLENCAITGCP